MNSWHFIFSAGHAIPVCRRPGGGFQPRFQVSLSHLTISLKSKTESFQPCFCNYQPLHLPNISLSTSLILVLIAAWTSTRRRWRAWRRSTPAWSARRRRTLSRSGWTSSMFFFKTFFFLSDLFFLNLGGERNRNQEFRFRFRQCRYRNFWQEKAREFVILWIDLRE